MQGVPEVSQIPKSRARYSAYVQGPIPLVVSNFYPLIHSPMFSLSQRLLLDISGFRACEDTVKNLTMVCELREEVRALVFSLEIPSSVAPAVDQVSFCKQRTPTCILSSRLPPHCPDGTHWFLFPQDLLFFVECQ
jgi:hypothetical protein